MLPLLFQHFQLTKDGNDFHASISVRILCLTSCFLLASFSLSLKNPLSVSCKAEDELTLASLRPCYPTLSEGWLNWLHYSWQVLSFRMLTRSFYLLGAARCPTPSNGIHSLFFFLDAFRMLLVTWIKSLETIDLPVPEDLCSSWRSCLSFIFFLVSLLGADFSRVSWWSCTLLSSQESIEPVSRLTDLLLIYLTLYCIFTLLIDHWISILK